MKRKKLSYLEIDIISSIEADFIEIIGDLFFQIKQNRQEILEIKKILNNINSKK